MPLLTFIAGVVIALIAFLLASKPQGALRFDRHQLIGIMAACIMKSATGGQQDFSESSFSMRSSIVPGEAVRIASTILEMVDNTWGPTPAIATEERARRIVDEEIARAVPLIIADYLEAEKRKADEAESDDAQKKGVAVDLPE